VKENLSPKPEVLFIRNQIVGRSCARARKQPKLGDVKEKKDDKKVRVSRKGRERDTTGKMGWIPYSIKATKKGRSEKAWFGLTSQKILGSMPTLSADSRGKILFGIEVKPKVTGDGKDSPFQVKSLIKKGIA